MKAELNKPMLAVLLAELLISTPHRRWASWLQTSAGGGSRRLRSVRLPVRQCGGYEEVPGAFRERRGAVRRGSISLALFGSSISDSDPEYLEGGFQWGEAGKGF